MRKTVAIFIILMGVVMTADAQSPWQWWRLGAVTTMITGIVGVLLAVAVFQELRAMAHKTAR